MTTRHAPSPARQSPGGPRPNHRQVNRLNRALVAAVTSGDLDRVSALIARGAEVNYRNRDGETPLTFAAAWDQLAAARVLLDHGADPNAADRHGGTALMWAAQHSEPALARALLAAGAEVDARDPAGRTALDHAGWRDAADPARAVLRRLLTKAAGGVVMP